MTLGLVKSAGISAVVAGSLLACSGAEAPAVAGDPERGREAVGFYGCGTCHTIPRVAGAVGQVGPPLTEIGRRAYLGGVLPNTPENMVRWLRDPRAVAPATAMPDTGVSEADALHITAFLYTLR